MVNVAPQKPENGKVLQPVLWVREQEAVVLLNKYFAVCDLLDLPSEILQGHHILLVDAETPEVKVREAVYRIRQVGNEPQIYETNLPLESLISHESTTVTELFGQIVDYSQPWDKWWESQKGSINTTEAVQIASVILKYSKFPELELEELRKRCGASGWDWKKILERLQEVGVTLNLPIPSEELEAKLAGLVAANLPKLKLEIEIAQIAKLSQIPEKTIWRIYREKEKEIDRQDDRQEIAKEVEQLLSATQTSLDLNSILPEKLAEPIVKLANRMSLRPECHVTAMLTTISTLHKVGTRLIISETDEFDVTPNLFSIIVALSSQKKSPILKSTVSRPLSILEAKAKEEYLEAVKKYEDDIKEYESIKDSEERKEKFPDGKPKQPRPKVYSFSGTNNEGLLRQVQEYPLQGLLGLIDEIAGYFKSANQYRKGRGSDEEDLLSYYDGTGARILRAGGVQIDLQGLSLGLLGTIQPGVLQDFLKDCNDSNGKWARFIFVNQPLVAAQLHDDGGSLNLTPMLSSLYKNIDLLPPTEYRLSKEAFKYYQAVYNKLEQKRVTDTLPGMSAVWGKTEGRIGKLAINLHVLKAVFNGEIPSTVIEKDTIVAATNLAWFYAQEVQSIYAQFSDPDAIAPNLAKTIQLSISKGGWIKAKDVQNSITRKLRPSAEVVRGWFQELEVMDLGATRGKGRSLEFCAKDLLVDKVDNKVMEVDDSSTTKNPSIVELPVQVVDKVDESRRLVDDLSTAKNLVTQEFEPFGRQSRRFFDPPTSPSPDSEQSVDEVDNLENSSTSSTLSTNDCNDCIEPVLTVDDLVDELSTFTKLSTLDCQVEVDPVSAVDDLVDELSTFTKSSTLSTLDREEVDPVPAVDDLVDNSSTLDRIEVNSASVVDDLVGEVDESSTEEVRVKINAQIIRECLAELAWDKIEALLEEWGLEFKKAVWKELSQEDKDAIKVLKKLNCDSVSNLKKGAEVLAKNVKTQEWLEGRIHSVETDPQGKFSHYVVRTSAGTILNIYSTDHLRLRE